MRRYPARSSPLPLALSRLWFPLLHFSSKKKIVIIDLFYYYCSLVLFSYHFIHSFRLQHLSFIASTKKTPTNYRMTDPVVMNNKNDDNALSSTSPKYTTLLLDMDGVLADVSQSYLSAIEQTCHIYGATSVTQQVITEWKSKGNANDDWKLSHQLILSDPIVGTKYKDNNLTLQQVIDTFEELYQGTDTKPGLYKSETLIPSKDTLIEIRKRCYYATGKGMGIVTGRPKNDCLKFLEDFQLTELFDAMYCMEDGPSKPNPIAIHTCCQSLGIVPTKSVLFIGDTPDDMNCAKAAGVSGIGVTTPEALAFQNAKNEPHHLAPLSIVMKEQCGADMILPPGFYDVIEMFPPYPDDFTI